MSIVVYGARGHARVLLELMDRAGIGPIAGLLDDDPALLHTKVDDIEVLGPISKLATLLRVHRIHRAVIAVGDNATRRRLAEHARSLGLRLPQLIHPSAIVSPTAHIGEGTVVLPGAIVGVCTTVGDLCILNTRSTIDHDCQIGDCVHIAPGATLTGRVTVCDGALIGAGATIIPDIVVGEESIIGAGATVIRDVPSHTTVVGCPARPIATRTMPVEPATA
jgi:sugar O-acyltransferase (sialic acid O-acetyltransferase NeuD family)